MAGFCLKSAILFFTQLYFIHIPGHFIALERCRNTVEDNTNTRFPPPRPFREKHIRMGGRIAPEWVFGLAQNTHPFYHLKGDIFNQNYYNTILRGMGDTMYPINISKRAN